MTNEREWLMGDLLTIREAADLVRTPVATMRYWRHLGVGPTGFKIGRRVVYRRADIDAWVLEQHAREHSKPA